MKKSDFTEKWQKVLIPAEVVGEGTGYELRIRDYKYGPCYYPFAEKIHRHFIPVKDWPKKEKGK